MKNCKDPLITVLMPVHNGERYIGEAIFSILKQTFRDFELLIINDHSTDKTLNVINLYKDDKIRLIHNNKKLGLAVTRQKGVDLSRGRIIAFLDSDDISHPDRLKDQIKYLNNDRNLGVIGSWVELIDSNGKRTGKVWKHASDQKLIPSILFFRSCFTQSAITLKKEILKRFPFRKEFWAAPDYDLLTRLSCKFEMSNIPKILTYYRYHESNMSKDYQDEITVCVNKIFKRNIANLGIQATDQDILVHRMLEPGKIDYKIEEINMIENWLNKLIAKNREKKLFDETSFQRIISDYWFKICASSACKGYYSLKRYKYSHLAQDNRIVNGLLKNIIIFVLCFFGKNLLIDITSDNWINIIPKILS